MQLFGGTSLHSVEMGDGSSPQAAWSGFGVLITRAHLTMGNNASGLRHGLMNAEQVASYLSVSRMRVYELARLGVLPSVRLGRTVRFDMTTIDRWIAEGGTGKSCMTNASGPLKP
jgi:excisionase family DNA binding protein